MITPPSKKTRAEKAHNAHSNPLRWKDK